MNGYFVAAGVLTVIVGAIHSVFGERLIFGRMRSAGLIPTNGGGLLRERHVRILWATWHVVTVMGWCFAAALFWLAIPSSEPLTRSFLASAVAVAMAASSVLVLVGTRGKHPGWIGLLLVAILTAAGRYA
jgi:hypothetical protein